MPGEINKDTHTDNAQFEGPVAVGNPHAKRPLDKKQGQQEPDTTVSKKDPGTVFPSGKVAEEIQKLFAGEGLSEGFASKASVLVEGAISESVSLLREQMEAEYAAKLEEAVAGEAEALVEKIDSYINYVASTYVTENKLAIEAGIKNEIAEQVMQSVSSIIEAAGINLPSEKVDVAEALTQEVIDLESKLNETMEVNVRLTEENKVFQVSRALEEMSDGLTVAGKDKLKRLAENISYDNIDDYKTKVAILKESVTDTAAKPTATGLNEQLQITPEKVVTPHGDRMAAYRAASQLI